MEIAFSGSGMLYIGVAAYKQTENADLAVVDTLRDIVPNREWKGSKIWPIYQIVRYDGNKNDIPDFKNLNQA